MEIPKRLSKVKPPFCAGCAFGDMTKQPSRHKGEKKAIFVATKPGECVSVDQMESTQLGFVAQAKGKTLGNLPLFGKSLELQKGKMA